MCRTEVPRERQPHQSSPIAASKSRRLRDTDSPGNACHPGSADEARTAQPYRHIPVHLVEPGRIGAMVEAHLGDDGSRAELELMPQGCLQLCVGERRVALRITGHAYARVGRYRSQLFKQRSSPGVRASVRGNVPADDEEFVDTVTRAADHQSPEVVAAGN